MRRRLFFGRLLAASLGVVLAPKFTPPKAPPRWSGMFFQMRCHEGYFICHVWDGESQRDQFQFAQESYLYCKNESRNGNDADLALRTSPIPWTCMGAKIPIIIGACECKARCLCFHEALKYAT